jgi:hypothetical protein
VRAGSESKGLKPGFHVIGSRVEPRRLSVCWMCGSGGVNAHDTAPPGSNASAAFAAAASALSLVSSSAAA